MTNLLLPYLKESDNGRVVNMSSIGQYLGVINFDDINNLVSKIPFIAYSRSKLAIVLFTRELAKRLKDTNISSYVVSPEFIKKPEFVAEIPLLDDWFSQITDPTIGAQTVLYVSMDESLRNESGFYYQY